MIKPAKGLGVLVAVVAGIAYGVSLVAARLSYEHGSNFSTIVALRFTVLSLILWGWFRLRRETLAMPGPVLRRALLVGALIVSTSIAYLASIAYIPVSLGALLFYTHPLIVVLLAVMLAGERSTALEIIATTVALIGLAFVLNVSFASLHPLGIFLGAYASVSAAIVFILSDRVMQSLDPRRFTLCSAVAGALIANSICIASGSMTIPVSGDGFFWLVVAVFVNVAGLLGMFTSVHMIGPVSTPMILNIEPITAIALALLLLDESLSAVQLAGAGMVILAVLTAQLSRAKRS